MNAFDQTASVSDGAHAVDPQHRSDIEALWFALEADRRAQDERLARLRTMKLIGGEDDAA
ncbi:hypothetical protein [Methylobacterium sp. PvR107]|uniref:hypothetical protein n=1 Tax=Methylobacterium sp. PvR107 TaxID=2806597 RepID=UPI001AE2B5E0|nr:hypothetical protein [Methylobacterium sp. PvR107]MBP1179619.1 hypothetical protein [Methylobacterium sp. PvR107]